MTLLQGKHAIRLGNDAEVSQDIKLEKGSTYSITFSAARTCAQLESLNVSMPPASQTIDLQTLYSVEGWNSYALAFQAVSDDAHVAFRNPGMEDDPTCGPILDNVAIKKLFVPDKAKGNLILITRTANFFHIITTSAILSFCRHGPRCHESTTCVRLQILGDMIIYSLMAWA